MENHVPSAVRSVERTLAPRYEAYLVEVRRLLDAASALIRDSGRIDPRVSEIVGAAGLSNQAFYRHFRSKDELLLALLDDGLRLLVSYLEHRMAGAASPAERVRSWLEGVLAQAVDPAAAAATRPFVLPRARLAERFPRETARSEELLMAPLRAALGDAAGSGELPGVDPARDADALYHLAMGWVQRQLAQGAAPASGDAEHLVAFAMQGLARRPATGRTGNAGSRDRGA